MQTALDYASELIEFDSVSSKSNLLITDHLEELLKRFGCDTERVDFRDPRGVPKANLIARLGSGHGGFAYFGHTDVVPAHDWKFAEHGPFQPTVRDGRLYGRGSCDMKGSVSCMLAVMASLTQKKLREPVYFCVTADEEVGMLGAMQVVGHSQLYREMVEHQTRAVVGEPTLFDVIYSHKGGCGVQLTAHGRAAHSSTSQGINANWKMIPFLAEMKALHDELESDPRWQNEEFDPPTMSLNLGINDHNPALNITAPQSVCTIYFRAMPGVDTDPVLDRIRTAAAKQGLDFELRFRATPFRADPQSPFVRECLEYSTNPVPRTVSYGTDAARFTELRNCVVMGPGSIAQAHTHDEWIDLTELERGTGIYRSMVERWCLEA
ncbi:M20 family metallopeptidase [Planctomicrobium sp. SH664]|uniref:M20 family metallopeptidase n=1 Tax=Planctomicrobium sp. SH664 TaxID=3448125 RepID=UPI003F5B6748